MCLECWVDAGCPSIETDRVLEMVPLLEKADEFGPLHLVVADWNLDDDCIRFCAEQEGRTADDNRAIELLLESSEAERYSAMAMARLYPRLELAPLIG